MRITVSYTRCLYDGNFRRVKDLGQWKDRLHKRRITITGGCGLIYTRFWARSGRGKYPKINKCTLPPRKIHSASLFSHRLAEFICVGNASSPGCIQNLSGSLPNEHMTQVDNSLDQEEAKVLVQLRTGHIPRNEYLARRNRRVGGM
jgi:hypothetical protein